MVSSDESEGRSLRFASRDNTILCSLSGRRVIDCESGVIALNPSEVLLAEALPEQDGRTIRIRHLAELGSEITTPPLWFTVRALWFSRESEFVIATDLAQNWQIVRTVNGSQMFEIPQSSLGCDVCDAAKQVVFWSSLRALHLASLRSELSTPALQTISLSAPARLVRFSPYGTPLAVLENQPPSHLSVLDMTGHVQWKRTGDRALTLDWSDDGRYSLCPINPVLSKSWMQNSDLTVVSCLF